MWKNKSSIQNSFLRKNIAIVITAIGLWSLIWIQSEYSEFKVEEGLLKKNYIVHQKKILKNEVSNAVEYIENIKIQVEDGFKSKLRQRVSQASQIAKNIYLLNRGNRTEEEIDEMIRTALTSIVCEGDNRCCFIGSIDEISRLSSGRTGNHSGDSTEDLIHEDVEIIKKNGEGFIGHFSNGFGNEAVSNPSQVIFVKHFKPMNCYISAGQSFESFENDLQKNVLTHLVSLRFGTDGYFFGSTFKGAPLFSNGKITLGTDNISDLTDVSGIKIIQKQIKAAMKPDGDFVNYSWSKIDSPTPRPKLSYIKGISEWGWLLGAGAYTDTIKEIIAKKKSTLYTGLQQRILRSGIVLFVLLCLIFLWSMRISNQIQQTMTTFLDFLRKASSDSITINPDKFQFEEFRAVAESTNNMLQKRQIAENALYESEETYRNLFQNAQVGLFRLRLHDGQILESNSQLARMFGFENRKLFIAASAMLRSHVTQEQQKKLRKSIERKGAIENVDIEFLRKDGAPFWVRCSARIFREKGYVEGVAEDITEQKRIAEALKKSEEQYRLLADNATDNIWILRLSDMRMLYSSPSVERLLGYSQEEFLSLRLEEFISVYSMEEVNETIAAELMKERDGSFDPKVGVVIQVELINKDKSTLWAEVKSSFLRDEKGEIDRILGITRDISERRLAEEEKIMAQKIAAENEKFALVGQIAGKMSHDFNNILGVIMGNAEISLLDCREEETRKTLELIFDQTKKGKNLTKNLVAFAKDQEPRHEFFNISEKTDLVVNLLKKDLADINIIREYDENTPELLADPGMIEHALVNIIQNAIHALSLDKSPVITIRTYCRDKNICIEIEDNGCGIPKEYLKSVYEPAFTLKGSKDVSGSYKNGIRGTGYGMANVKKYIGQHQGMIELSTESGSGTKFIVSLPLIKRTLTIEEKATLKSANLHSRKKILLVEDEKSISDVQKMVLADEPCFHNVDIADNGVTAIDLFDNNDYDIVSLDYILPGDVNGMDIYHHIRDKDKEIPILFISGNIEFLESIKELKQKDINTDHLSKPCQNTDYLNRLNSLLDKVS